VSGETVDSVCAIMLVDLIKPCDTPGFVFFAGLPMFTTLAMRSYHSYRRESRDDDSNTDRENE